MINRDQIIKLATKLQTSEVNVEREYCQHLFLNHFYQTKKASKVLFKGGTALKLLYHSPRFSEDLDFSSNIDDTKMIEEILEKSLASLEKENVKVDIVEAKMTTGGYLAIISFSVFERSNSVQFEMSLRDSDNLGEVVTVVNECVPTYTVHALRIEKLVDEKIQALIERNKPRDFYDVYFLLRAGLVPVDKKLELVKVLDLIKNAKVDFEKELMVFLPKSHFSVIKDFKNTLNREIQRNL